MKSVTKTLLNRGLNLILLLNGAFLLGSGWVIDQRLPRGRDGHDLELLGLDRHAWGDLHAWGGYLIGALVVAHLVLHTTWLWRVAAKTQPWKLAVGLGATALIVSVFVLYPLSP